MPIVNPATEEQVGTFPLGKRYDLDRVVLAAKTAFETYHNLAKMIDLTCKKVKIKSESGITGINHTLSVQTSD